jgi:hypothetical protein
MLDYLHLPKQQNGNIDYFPGISDADGAEWIAWEKPTGTHMIRITCIAGGGGGGSGFSNNTTTNRGGGGGGGSSAISIVTIPAYVLPDILYISSGIGGAGGEANPATANLGSNGIRSYVCIAPDTLTSYRVCYADSGKAGTTVPTSVPAGGTAGSGGTIATIVDMPLACYGIRNFIGGNVGTAGGSTSAAIGPAYPITGLLLSGGSGGSGGENVATTSINAPTQTVYNIFSPLTSVTGSGSNGEPGREIYQPLLATGGCGAAANFTTGAGGAGGAGGFGSGGGGGGAGGAAAAGGGGKGGNGLVVIHSW